MAKPKSQLDHAQGAASKVSFDDFIEMLNSPKRLAWLNFYTGFVRGLASVIGAAIAIVLIGLAVTYLGGIPLIGEFIKQVGQAAGQAAPASM